jgi:hypothetical protein
MRYLHYAPREEDGELVAEAFRVAELPAAWMDSEDVLGHLGTS